MNRWIGRWMSGPGEGFDGGESTRGGGRGRIRWMDGCTNGWMDWGSVEGWRDGCGGERGVGSNDGRWRNRRREERDGWSGQWLDERDVSVYAAASLNTKVGGEKTETRPTNARKDRNGLLLLRLVDR